MQIKKHIFLIMLLFFGLESKMIAKDKFLRALVEDRNGAYYLLNGPNKSITVKVDASDIKVTKAKGFISADNQLLQVQSIPLPESDLVDSIFVFELLKKHMESELDYIKNDLHENISSVHYDTLSVGGRQFLFWRYSMPSDNHSLKSQLYFTTRCFNQILIINAPVYADSDESKVKDILLSMCKTVKQYDYNIDSGEFHKQLMNEK